MVVFLHELQAIHPLIYILYIHIMYTSLSISLYQLYIHALSIDQCNNNKLYYLHEILDLRFHALLQSLFICYQRSYHQYHRHSYFYCAELQICVHYAQNRPPSYIRIFNLFSQSCLNFFKGIYLHRYKSKSSRKKYLCIDV